MPGMNEQAGRGWKELLGVYGPGGRWRDKLTRSRVQKLHDLCVEAIRDEDVRKQFKPGDLIWFWTGSYSETQDRRNDGRGRHTERPHGNPSECLFNAAPNMKTLVYYFPLHHAAA